jgi:hypothetical protein
MLFKMHIAIVRIDTISCPDVTEKGGRMCEPVSLLANTGQGGSR